MKVLNILWITLLFQYTCACQKTNVFEKALHFDQPFLIENQLFPFANQSIDIASLKENASILTPLFQPLALSSYESFEARSKDLFVYLLANRNDNNEQIALQVALIAFEENEFDEAVSFFEQMNPGILKTNDEAYFLYAYSLFASKKFQMAKDIFEIIRNKSGDYAHFATYYAGMSSFFLGKPDESIALLSQVDNIEPFQNYTPYYLAQLYFSQEKYITCIQYIENIPTRNRQHEMYRILGQSYFLLEDYPAAHQNLAKYLDKNTKGTTETAFQYGYASYKTNKLDLAELYFNKIALDNSPLSFFANYYLSDIYYQEGFYLKSLASTEQLIDQSTDPALTENLIYNAGMLAYKTESNRRSLDHFNSLDRQSLYRPTADKYINQILLGSEDLDGSIAFIEKQGDQSSFKETYSTLILSKSRQLYNDKQYSLASKTLNKITSNNADQNLQQEAAYLHGRIALKNNQKTAAIEHFNQLKQGQKDYASSQYFLGNIYQLIDQKTAAKTAYKTAIKAGKTSSESAALTDNANLQLAALYLEEKEYKQGLKYLTKSSQSSTIYKDYTLYISSYVSANEGNIGQQKAYLSELINNHPQSNYAEQSSRELSQLLIKENKGDEAMSLLENLANSEDKIIAGDALLQQALIHYNNNDIKEAIRLYKRVVETPSSTDQKLSAIAALKEIYLRDLKETNTLFNYLSDETDYELSSIAKDSLSYKTAYAYYSNGEYRKSIINLESYVSDYPNGLFLDEANYTIAESYALLQENENALPYYQKVIANEQSAKQLNATKKAALIALNQQQDYGLALEYFESIYTNTLDENVRLESAESALYCAFKLGDTDNIITYGQKVAEHHSTGTKEKATAYYYLGKTQINKAPDQAIQAFNKVVQLLGTSHNISAESTYLLASIFYQKSDLEATERQCLEAIKRASKYPKWVAKSLLLLSDVYLDKEDYLNAKATSEAVIENYREDASIYQEATDKLILINAAYSKNKLKETNINEVEFEDIQDEQ